MSAKIAFLIMILLRMVMFKNQHISGFLGDIFHSKVARPPKRAAGSLFAVITMTNRIHLRLGNNGNAGFFTAANGGSFHGNSQTRLFQQKSQALLGFMLLSWIGLF